MIDRDIFRCFLIRNLEPGYVLLHGIVRSYFSLLDQLCNGESGERFALRADIHRRLWRHWSTLACRAITFEIYNFCFGCHGERDASNPMLVHLRGDIRIQGIPIDFGGGDRVRFDRNCPHRQAEEHHNSQHEIQNLTHCMKGLGDSQSNPIVGARDDMTRFIAQQFLRSVP
jgi:hypothetical protein